MEKGLNTDDCTLEYFDRQRIFNTRLYIRNEKVILG